MVNRLGVWPFRFGTEDSRHVGAANRLEIIRRGQADHATDIAAKGQINRLQITRIQRQKHRDLATG